MRLPRFSLLLKIQVFWRVTLCLLVSSSRRFEVSYYILLHSPLSQRRLLDLEDENSTILRNVWSYPTTTQRHAAD
jgi:hypothetical protein